MPIYMKLGDIKGDVTAKGHEKWIELESCQFGIHRAMHMDTGRSGNRESAKPNFGETVVTTSLDQSAGPALDATWHGQDGCEITIDYVSTDDGSNNIYRQIKMWDALISSFNVSSAGQSRPMISMSLNPAKVEYKYMEQAPEGAKAGAPSSFIYNIAEGAKG